MNELDQWFEGAVPDFAQALQPVLSGLAEGLADADVSGFGVLADMDDFSVSAAVNTREHEAEQVKALLADHYDQTDSECNARWEPKRFARTADPHGDAGQRLRGLAEEAARRSRAAGDVQDGASQYAQVLARALGRLYADGFFRSWPNADVVLWLPEGQVDPATLEQWGSSYNDPADLVSYRKWLWA